MKLEKTVNGATFSVSSARGVFPNARRVKADIRLIRPGKPDATGRVEFCFGPLPDNKVDRTTTGKQIADLLGPKYTFGPLRWHVCDECRGLVFCNAEGVDHFVYSGEVLDTTPERCSLPEFDWCRDVCDTFGLALKSHVAAECEPEYVRY